MTKTQTIVSAIFLSLLFSTGARANGESTANTDAGKALAKQLCARCHAIEQTGDSPFEPAPPFRMLPHKYELENLEEALAEGISVGHEAMPEFEFSPEQIDQFLAYLRTLN